MCVLVEAPHSRYSQGPQPPHPLLTRTPSVFTVPTSAPWSGYSSLSILNSSNHLSSLSLTLVTSASKLTEPVPQLSSTSSTERHSGSSTGPEYKAPLTHTSCAPFFSGAAPSQAVARQEMISFSVLNVKGKSRFLSLTLQFIWDMFTTYHFLTSHISPFTKRSKL